MVIFIIACIVLNVAVSEMEMEYNWRTDLSFNQYATTGEETAQMISELTLEVKIYLLYTDNDEDIQLLEVLYHYEGLSDLITVYPTDIAQNPGILTRFADGDTEIGTDTVVVNCVATGRYRVLNYNDFFAQSYDVDNGTFVVDGLAYEKKITEAIAYTVQEEVPVIGFLQGHGELSESQMSAFIEFLESNHYDTAQINLLMGDSLDTVDMIVIAGLQKDLAQEEVEMIDAFCQEGGSMIVMRDYGDAYDSVPTYLAMLRSFGIRPLEGIVVADENDTQSYYQEPIYLMPYMTELDMTLSLIASGMDVLLLTSSSAFEDPDEPTSEMTTSAVLVSGDNSYLRNVFDGESTIDQQPTDPVGTFNLALYTHRMHSNGNISRVFAIGNSSIFTDSYIYERTFNQEFFVSLLNEFLPQKTLSLDIVASDAFRPALQVGSLTAGITILVSIPVLVLLLSLFVLIPRKNR